MKQLRLWHARYRGKDGQWRPVRTWSVAVRDHRTPVHRFVKFSIGPSRTVAERVGAKVQDLLNDLSTDKSNPDLVAWLQTHAPRHVQRRLVAEGILPSTSTKDPKPMKVTLAEFQQHVIEQAKRSRIKKDRTGDTSGRTVTARIKKMVTGCEFKTLSDVTADKINIFIDQAKVSQQTKHFYGAAARRFLSWCVDQGHLDHGVLRDLRAFKPAKNYGRCFQVAEFEGLLQAARTGPTRYGLTGWERFLLYQTALVTGFRRAELAALTVGDLDLPGCRVFLKADLTKNGDQAAQYITPDLRDLLIDHIRGKLPGVRLFEGWDWHGSGKMVADDCKAAGIEVINSQGRLNLHSIRHTTGTFLLSQGVQVKTVQAIMRHKTFSLTMDRYAHHLDGAVQRAVNKMPIVGLVQQTTEATA